MTGMTRRMLVKGTCCGAAGAAIAGLGGVAHAAGPATSKLANPPGHGKTSLTADQALDLLKQGNRGFITDSPVRSAVGRARRLEIARGQTPFAVLVSCSDSRVPPELLFGRGLGELFIIRNAGNTVDLVAQGSIEYAVAELGVPLVVVMGHERCGAVGAAMAVAEKNATFPGSIGRVVEPILPAVLAARGTAGDPFEAAVRQNIRRVVGQLRTELSQPVLAEGLRGGRIRVVGAYYHLDSGQVDFFDEAPSPTA